MERTCVPERHYPETKSFIPNDIILIIFSLIPYRNVLTFKCVCKAWYALISNDLADLYLKCHRENSEGLVVCHSGGSKENPHLRLSFLQTAGRGLKTLITKPEIDFKEKKGYIRRVYFHSTINGVVCFSNDLDVYVCNPLTGEFVTLPAYNGQYSRPPGDHDGNGYQYAIPHEYDGIVFGYCPCTCEYKVIRGFVNRDGNPAPAFGKPPSLPHKFAVITVGSPSNSLARLWRDMEYPLPLSREFSDSVCLNGIIYMGTTGYGDEIVTFDVRKEKFKLLAGPQIDCFPYEYRKLAQLRGNLCVINTFLATLDFWMMIPYDQPDLDGGSWDRVCKIPLVDFLPYSNEEYFDCRFFNFSGLDKGKLLISIGGSWFLYDMKSRLLERIDFGGACIGFEIGLSPELISLEESLAAVVPVPSANFGHEV